MHITAAVGSHTCPEAVIFCLLLSLSYNVNFHYGLNDINIKLQYKESGKIIEDFFND